jgi:hypothetical protein
LIWHLMVGNGADVLQGVFVDAHSGELVYRYSLLEHAMDRHVFDAAGSFILPFFDLEGMPQFPGGVARGEGDAATGVRDVDQAYEFLGDSYNFFLEHHDRDSMDDEGMPIVATVRLPFFNAFFDFFFLDMGFGTGLAVSDVVGHEYTHGVTAFTSNLIYFGWSGAINESFSDIWGEFIDLTGADPGPPEVRWFIGEDIDPLFVGDGPPVDLKRHMAVKQGNVEIPGYAFRYMADPPLLGDPDRLGSPLVANVNSFFDNGGVHINSGIGNKLAYLLTDGDEFNGFTVEGLGIPRVANLFYETQFLLTPAADYHDLYLALGAATVNQDYTFDERLNVANAARAVEITPPGLRTGGLRDFRATPTRDLQGNAVIALTWALPTMDFDEIILLRDAMNFPQDTDTGQELLRSEEADRFLDALVQDGVEYFYTLIAATSEGFPQISFARATAGAEAPSYFTETFTGGTLARPAIDLANTQLLFSPAGPPPGTAGVTSVGGYGGYELTVQHGVSGLPEPRRDDSAFLIPSTDDGGVIYSFGDQAFPFFGRMYGQVYLASNGYISFEPIAPNSALNFPSRSAHFAVPRISYLFSDLAPNSGGLIWGRSHADKVVLTFENVPEWRPMGSFGSASTVQVELFFTGHIRITYGQLGVLNAVVGLSDGNGVPPNLAELFENVQPVQTMAQLSAFPADSSRIVFTPTGAGRVEAGGQAAFTAQALVPPQIAGVPALWATWDGPGTVPFSDNGDGSGDFAWQTTLEDNGTYIIRVHAELGGAEAHQDVRLIVGEAFPAPEARNLRIDTGTPSEVPTESRIVPPNRGLSGDYDYFHPLQAQRPIQFSEGASLIYWMRNGQAVQALTNQLAVPASLVQPGDQWHFRVSPQTISGITGPQAVSPMVAVQGMPEIISVSPSFGPTQGGTTVRIRGERLSSPTLVRFGNLPAQSVRALSNTEIEATSPVHAAGTVAVSVTTVLGTTTLANAFTYTGETAGILRADVNGDGKVDAVDIQIVVNAVLQREGAKESYDADVNRDGKVDAADLQLVVNHALGN